MGDLAVAIVDLGRGSEDRRNARRELRDAVETVADEILRHTRTGDYAVMARLGRNDVFYVAERIGWPLTTREASTEEDDIEHFSTKGASALVRYQGTPVSFGTTEETPVVHGAVLNDPRTPQVIDDVLYQPLGRELYRLNPQTERIRYEPHLHLATDEELMSFANEVQALVQSLASQFHRHAENFRGSATKLTRLTPR